MRSRILFPIYAALLVGLTFLIPDRRHRTLNNDPWKLGGHHIARDIRRDGKVMLLQLADQLMELID